MLNIKATMEKPPGYALGLVFNPKRAGGGAEFPLECYFFALKLHDFFSSSLELNLRPF